ncbi:hypothetical protein NIES2100_21700 [Calothrix sp. NIES-2100]|uniref:hypothetical protein n=1 Tax=Calothrix sp. NIES-2100 TaxID=1954172 RepID=UPI000B5F2C23|nr:hypothetical protein NIES2100_21700 [Calothrix sp. NIES-2100]
MNPQPEEDLQRRLQKLEAEINSQPEKPRPSTRWNFESINSQLMQLQSRFNSLTGTKKLVVLGVTVLLGLAMVQVVFKLVASAISLAVLAGLVYVGYKFFVSSSFQQKK